jgi:hypothetical protein
MNLLIDFINKEGTKGYASRPDKIYSNFCLLGVLDQYVAELQKRKGETVSIMTLFGKWIIIFQGGDINTDDSVMHTIDFRTDLKTEYRPGFFSDEIMEAFVDIQTNYSKVYTKDADFIELTYAEPHEKVVKSNLFLCEGNEMVFQKAETLGILGNVKNMSEDGEMKVLIAQEKIIVENNDVINLYAIINFQESEYVYLKIYDLENNLERLDDFQTSIELTGVKFDKSLLKYLTKEALN